jgi:hypothetical protein
LIPFKLTVLPQPSAPTVNLLVTVAKGVLTLVAAVTQLNVKLSELLIVLLSTEFVAKLPLLIPQHVT